MNQAVGVLIIDEPAEPAPTFRAVLEHEPNLRTIGEAEFVHALTATGTGPAVALVFLADAEARGGIARILGLKQRRPHLRVLAAFRILDAETLCALAAAGADAFIALDTPPRAVCAAILALAGRAPHAEAVSSPAVCEGLTPREVEILRFLSAGFSNKEVARRLSLSVRTVETHRLNLRRKTQTGRLKDLVLLARQLRLAPVLDDEPQHRAVAESAHRPRPSPIQVPARH